MTQQSHYWHIPWENPNSERHECPSAHCSIVHNGPATEAAWMPINRWMDKKAVAHICNGILLNHKKEWIWASCSEVDEPRAPYQSEIREKPIWYINTYTWNLENAIDEPICRNRMETQMWRSSVGNEPACNAGDPGLIPGLGRSPGEGNGNPLQYSCPENLMEPAGLVQGVGRVGHDLVTEPWPGAEGFFN